MKKRALIFLNGEYAAQEPITELAFANHLVIGVDGGARHIAACGLIPQVIIGDMDSLPASDLSKYVSQGTLILRHPTEKDETDFELALEHAIQEGCDDIVIFGVLGGRIDHMIANILTPLVFLDKADIRLVRGAEEITYITSRSVIHGKAGDVLSLLPVTGNVTGVKTTGLLYPLKSETLIFGKSRGVSNELTGTRAVVSVTSGILLCIHTNELHAFSGKEKT